MKKLVMSICLFVVFVFGTMGIIGIIGTMSLNAVEQAPKKIIDLANSVISKLGNDPIIVKAVKLENAKGKTLSQIQEMDKKWIATPGIADFMRNMMNSECGKHLLELRKKIPGTEEIIVMDNQGSNVAILGKTSDYWQGDEDKFAKTYNSGKGAIFVDNVKFDESSQMYMVQISVPVRDGNKAIGVLTFGINTDKIK